MHAKRLPPDAKTNESAMNSTLAQVDGTTAGEKLEREIGTSKRGSREIKKKNNASMLKKIPIMLILESKYA